MSNFARVPSDKKSAWQQTGALSLRTRAMSNESRKPRYENVVCAQASGDVRFTPP